MLFEKANKGQIIWHVSLFFQCQERWKNWSESCMPKRAFFRLHLGWFCMKIGRKTESTIYLIFLDFKGRGHLNNFQKFTSLTPSCQYIIHPSVILSYNLLLFYYICSIVVSSCICGHLELLLQILVKVHH